MQKSILIPDILASFFFFITSIFFLLYMDDLIYEGLPSVISPAVFPTFIGLVVATLSAIFFLFSMIIFLKKLLGKDGTSKNFDALFIMQILDEDNDFSAKRCTYYVLLLIAYSQLFFLLGFLLSTPIIMVAIAYLLGGRRFHVLLPMFILLAFIINYVSFHYLRIALPALNII